MTQILAALNELLVACQGVRALLQTVYNLVVHTAQENVPFHITTEVDIIGAVVTDASFGNQQINTNLLGLVTTLTADFDALSAQIAALPQVGDPVVLPDPITSGGQNLTTDAIASAVWVFRGPTTDDNAIDLLEDAAVPQIGWSTFTDHMASYHVAPWQWLPNTNISVVDSGASDVPPLDYTTILASDTDAVEWLNRVAEDTIVFDIGSGVPGFSSDGGAYFWIPWLDTGMFNVIKNAVLSGAPAPMPPIWPGLSRVTFGTPVALSTGVTVSGPLQGVLIALTSVPSDKSFFDFDGDLSYRNLGAITFQTDNGDDEFPQSLGFTSAVFTPKSMSVASACLIRTTGGVVGTVTPFTIP